MITLTYNPLTGILTVTIVKAKDLKPMDISGTSGQIMCDSLVESFAEVKGSEANPQCSKNLKYIAGIF